MSANHLRLVRPARGDATAPLGKPRRRRDLGEILVASGALSPGNHIKALALLARQETRLADILLAHGMVDEPALMNGLAQQWGARVLDPVAEPPDTRLVDQFGPASCIRDGLLPWRRAGGITVIVAARPETFEQARSRLIEAFGPVALALASESRLHEALLAIRQADLRRRAEASVPPDESCRGWRPERLARLGAILGVATLILGLLAPALLLGLLALLAIATLAASTSLRIAALAARLPSLLTERRQQNPLGDKKPTPMMRLPVVSILVPMFREPDIAPRLVARLGHLNYPRELLDVILVVEETDRETRDALAHGTLPRWMRVVPVPDGPVRTKPRAMNFALDFARGSIIGVYDAEDAPASDQLHRVVRRFHECPPEVVCLQGVLDYYNARTNWLSRCFTVEYASWFRVILPGLQRLGLPLPLGGTTLFMRRNALEHLGRWDAHNVTEDADLGIRLARHGFRTEVLPTVTEEEANCRALPWVRQRSRWIKGHAITWAVHMRDPAALRRDLGARGFWGMQMIFAGAVAQPLLAPVLWTFWALAFGFGHPLAGALSAWVMLPLLVLFIAAELVNIACGALATATPERRFLLPWVPTLHFYHPLATFAAVKAVYELARRPFYWDKTAHGIFDGDARLDAPPEAVNA